jgi:hypothetical protein
MVLVRRLARDPEALHDLDASFNPYGFVTIAIGPALDPPVDTRIHIWPVGERVIQTPCWPIHCHGWDLRSHVLTGRLVSETFSPVPTKEISGQAVYVPRSRGTETTLVPTGSLLDVRTAAVATHATGSTYALPAGVYHRAVVDEGTFCATLAVIREPPLAAEACVLGPPRQARQPPRFRRRRPPPGLLAELLEQLVSAVA